MMVAAARVLPTPVTIAVVSWNTRDLLARCLESMAPEVERGRGDATMTRNWRYLIFPAHSGAFTLPALTSTILTPAGTRHTLRCEARTLNVQAASAEERHPRAPASTRHFDPASLLPAPVIRAADVKIS